MQKDEELELDGEELEEEDDIIELEDEEGKIVKCVILDVIKHKGERYEVLMPAEPNENIAEDEVIILRLNEEEAMLETIEDENLLQEVFELFQQGGGEDDGEEDVN